MEDEKSRLTFAIISHPDAGKTTITEKLLFFGGAIHMAGAVKSKKNERQTVSDFMKMEKDRGISVSTSVMGFDYRGRKVNLLDTPGHADFSEDTYRTLTAVDSALMVIDSVKGVEERTRKLAEVCRMRTTPIISFINKMDREGKEPLELLDEVEAELDIRICPMSWPVGQGKEFKGVYSLPEKRLILFTPHQTQNEDSVVIDGLEDPLLDQKVGDSAAAKLREEVSLLEEVYDDFDQEQFLAGAMTPVFFGSAINNFGVRELLDCFAAIAPPPLARKTEERIIEPTEENFTGFIFKIHANLNPKHRDRIAFMRVCSGLFERNKPYLHVKSGKTFKASNPTAFMARERNVVDQAYPGDIIGLHDTGSLRIGDAITQGEKLTFKGIPSFAPQIFRQVVNTDPMRSKQYEKGLDQLAQEGVVQIFRWKKTRQRVIGVVGILQLEVVQHRMEEEYNASCRFEPIDYHSASWVVSEDKEKLDKFLGYYENRIAEDVHGRPIFMARNRWLLDQLRAENPGVEFHFTSDTLW